MVIRFFNVLLRWLFHIYIDGDEIKMDWFIGHLKIDGDNDCFAINILYDKEGASYIAKNIKR